MAEIIYQYHGEATKADFSDIRWLNENELSVFNRHLECCGQKPISDELWAKIYTEGTVYCLLWCDGLPVARACVEPYSSDKWEVSDVRVAKEYRNRGFAYRVSLFVRNHILKQNKIPTIRTEQDNVAMQRVIQKLGFEPMRD